MVVLISNRSYLNFYCCVGNLRIDLLRLSVLFYLYVFIFLSIVFLLDAQIYAAELAGVGRLTIPWQKFVPKKSVFW